MSQENKLTTSNDILDGMKKFIPTHFVMGEISDELASVILGNCTTEEQTRCHISWPLSVLSA
ncbi:hypothetical protein HA050_11650 [Iodobacter sp. HSC-16F04]|uniref:Uncharacterized protein n=1 Tax=Iodobacter violaceini TaxID=3044271 RepID=A0ABX0KX32_9NEIS|nr:hypothetical protein [Iodobacter violacea]NHQ86772.1 hypothetical protein [Iodobacter violacea]